MKELKIGMYVRTHNGFISKIIEISREPISRNEIILIKGNYKGNKDEEYGYVRDYYKKGTSFVYRGEIKEVSENIIDLIDTMDLLFVDIDNGYEGGIIVPRIAETMNELNEIKSKIKSGNLKLKYIVTREQIENLKYDVE